MASERRLAHFGLASACTVLVTTLTILYQGSAPRVVRQEPTVVRTASAGDAGRAAASPALNVAVMNK